MEYEAQFSGNGTASMSFVRSLRTFGDEVLVLSASPPGHQGTTQSISVPVSHWGIHGVDGPWKEFADNSTSTTILKAIQDFSASPIDHIIAVDWEGIAVWKALQAAGAFPSSIPLCYYNFRVFYKNTGCSAEDIAFYETAEYNSCVSAEQIVCLCGVDRVSLVSLMEKKGLRGKGVGVLLPGLRNEICAFVDQNEHRTRQYLLCCVRIIKEKNIMVFAETIQHLISQNALSYQGTPLTPCMVGSVADHSYGDSVEAALKSACPSAIIKGFLAPSELADIMKQSVLNFHPALNEAYGMTIVEAAALGCPSIVNVKDIGAVSLLSSKREGEEEEVFLGDMSDASAAAGAVRAILQNEARLSKVASAAQRKALSYGESENGASLRALLCNREGRGGKGEGSTQTP